MANNEVVGDVYLVDWDGWEGSLEDGRWAMGAGRWAHQADENDTWSRLLPVPDRGRIRQP